MAKLSSTDIEGNLTVLNQIAAPNLESGGTSSNSVVLDADGKMRLKLDNNHNHTISNVTNLQTTLDGKEDKLSTNVTTKTTPVNADVIVINDSADSNKTKKLSFTNLKTYLSGLYAALVHNHSTLNGGNGTKVIAINDEAGNTKFIQFYSNGSYNYIIGDSTNGSAGNMVFQANNAGQVIFNTSSGGTIVLQTNGSGAIYLNTPDFVVNTNNHIQTDAASSVINKLPNRAGRLMVEERITISQSAPSGGLDGDIWITY